MNNSRTPSHRLWSRCCHRSERYPPLTVCVNVIRNVICISLLTPWKHGGIAPRFLTLGTRSLYPQDGTTTPSEYETGWAARPVWPFLGGKKILLPLPAFDPRTFQPLAQLLYRWRQPGLRYIVRAFHLFVMFHRLKTALLSLIHGQSELDVRYAGTLEFWLRVRLTVVRSLVVAVSVFLHVYFTMWWRQGCQLCSYCKNLQAIWEADVYVVVCFNVLSLPVTIRTTRFKIKKFCMLITLHLPYILESNPHHFYSFGGLKNQMRIRIACGLNSRSWAGFWKNDRAAVRAVRRIQYNNLLFYFL
jgi:hypothetical protein